MLLDLLRKLFGFGGHWMVKKQPHRHSSVRLGMEALETRDLLTAAVPGFELTGGNLYHIVGSQPCLIDTAVKDFAVINDKVLDLHANGELTSLGIDGSQKSVIDTDVKSMGLGDDHGLYYFKNDTVYQAQINGTLQGHADVIPGQSIVLDNDGTLWFAPDEHSPWLIAKSVSAWEKAADGSVYYFQKNFDGREDVLQYWSPQAGTTRIQDGVVNWKTAADGGVYLFRWESAGQPETLDHWSAQAGRVTFADHVNTWEVAPDGGVYYFQKNFGGREDVLQHWSPQAGTTKIQDGVVNWKTAADGGVYLFRWESAGQPETLDYWSAQAGRVTFADHVKSWEVVSDSVSYFRVIADVTMNLFWLPHRRQAQSLTTNGDPLQDDIRGVIGVEGGQVLSYVVGGDGRAYFLTTGGTLYHDDAAGSATIVGEGVLSYALGGDGKAYFLQSDGHLYHDGVPSALGAGANVASFLVGGDGRAFFLTADGTLYHDYAGNLVQRQLDTHVSNYALDGAGNVITLHTDPGTAPSLYTYNPKTGAYVDMIYRHAVSFVIDGGGGTVALDDAGNLWRFNPGGRYAQGHLDSHVTALTATSQGTFWFLRDDGRLATCVNGVAMEIISVDANATLYGYLPGQTQATAGLLRCGDRIEDVKTFDEIGDGRIYALTTEGILKVHDANGWSDIQVGRVRSFAITKVPNAYYVLTEDGTWLFHDAGGTWNPIQIGAVKSFAIANDGVLYALTADNVMHVHDANGWWEIQVGKVKTFAITSIASTYYLLTEDGRLLYHDHPGNWYTLPADNIGWLNNSAWTTLPVYRAQDSAGHLQAYMQRAGQLYQIVGDQLINMGWADKVVEDRSGHLLCLAGTYLRDVAGASITGCTGLYQGTDGMGQPVAYIHRDGSLFQFNPDHWVNLGRADAVIAGPYGRVCFFDGTVIRATNAENSSSILYGDITAICQSQDSLGQPLWYMLRNGTLARLSVGGDAENISSNDILWFSPAAGGKVYALNRDSCIIRWDDNHWTEVSGRDIQLVYIVDGDLFALTRDHRVARRHGDTWKDLTGRDIQQMFVVDGKLFALNYDSCVIRWDNNHWTEVSAYDIRQIAYANGNLFALNRDSCVIRWDSNHWTEISSHDIQTIVMANGNLYALNRDPRVIRWDGNHWTLITNFGVVGLFNEPTGRLAAVNSDGSLLRFAPNDSFQAIPYRIKITDNGAALNFDGQGRLVFQDRWDYLYRVDSYDRENTKLLPDQIVGFAIDKDGNVVALNINHDLKRIYADNRQYQVDHDTTSFSFDASGNLQWQADHRSGFVKFVSGLGNGLIHVAESVFAADIAMIGYTFGLGIAGIPVGNYLGQRVFGSNYSNLRNEGLGMYAAVGASIVTGGALAPHLGAVLAGGLAGAAGSASSQAVTIGLTSGGSFNWSQVGIGFVSGTIGAGVTQGLAYLGNPLGVTGTQVLSAVSGNLAGQSLSGHFDLTSLVMSAGQALAMAGAQELINQSNAASQPESEPRPYYRGLMSPEQIAIGLKQPSVLLWANLVGNSVAGQIIGTLADNAATLEYAKSAIDLMQGAIELNSGASTLNQVLWVANKLNAPLVFAKEGSTLACIYSSVDFATNATEFVIFTAAAPETAGGSIWGMVRSGYGIVTSGRGIMINCFGSN